jgi:hypothetical protein
MLETKGSCIQTMILSDITKFSTSELIVGDTFGEVTLFSKGEILSRQFLSHGVTTLTAHDSYIIIGDRGGNITAFRAPNQVLWKKRLQDDPRFTQFSPLTGTVNDFAVLFINQKSLDLKILPFDA